MTRAPDGRRANTAATFAARAAWRREATALCLLLVAVLLAGLMPGPRAAAAEPTAADRAPEFASPGEGALGATITGLSPAVPRATSTLKVKGTVRNTSKDPVTAVAVVLRISPTPLYSRSEIPAVISGNTTREGLPVSATFTELTPELSPDQTIDYSLTVPVADLDLPRAGVYVTAVEVLGDTGGGRVRQSLARTFLPWWPEDEEAPPVGLTLLWPLTGPPERDAKGIFLTDDLAVEMSLTGRLDNLLSAASEYPKLMTWVIDPQVAQAAEDMSDGYEVYVDPGAGVVAPGTRAGEARRWLAGLIASAALPQTPIAADLYGNPDIDAARQGRALGNLLSQDKAVNRQLAGILGTPVSLTLSLPPGGNAGGAAIESLAGADVTGLVLADTSMPPLDPPTYTPSGSAELATDKGAIPVLLADSGLSAALGMAAATRSDEVAIRQRFLAETEVAALEAPSVPRVLTAAPPVDWAPSLSAARSLLKAIGRAPWIAPVSAGSVLASPDTELARRHVPLSSDQVAAQLPASHVEQVRESQKQLTAYRAMVTDPDSVSLTSQQAPARELSSYFRIHATSRSVLSVLVGRQIGALAESVQIISSGSVTISGDSGTIPITVANTGPEEVTVGLELTSNPPQLFEAQPIKPFQIDPGRRTSVEVKAKIAGSGRIPVTLRLTSASGKPVGEPSILIVRSAAYAKAARLLVQLSLVLLVLAVLLHGIRRVRRATRARSGGRT